MITASIVTYRSDREVLGRAIASAVASSIERVYIVDNSPTDDLREFILSFDPDRVEYIWGQGNVGFGTAHNIALNRSIDRGATYHIFINPDVEFEEGVIDELSRYMDDSGDVGYVMPKVCYPDGQIQLNCKLLPTPTDLIFRRFIPIKSLVKRINDRYEMSEYRYDRVADIPFMVGCFIFARIEAMRAIDGFDQRYFMYCEDIDLGRRVQDAGFRTVCYPHVTITHVYEQESHKSFKLLRSHIHSAIQYFNKWGWVCDSRRGIVNKRAIEALKS